MPTYQYACTDCGDRSEAVQKFTDDPLTVCTVCGGKLRKVFSAVGIVFKGSGFYRTDSRSSSTVAADSGAKDGGTDKSGSGSSDKAASAANGSSSSTAAKSDSGGSSSSGSGSSGSSGDKKAATTGSSGSGSSGSSGSKVA